MLSRLIQDYLLVVLLPTGIAVVIGIAAAATVGRGGSANEAHAAQIQIDVGDGQLARSATHILHLDTARETIKRLPRVIQSQQLGHEVYQGFLREPSLRVQESQLDARARALTERLEVVVEPTLAGLLLVRLRMRMSDMDPDYPDYLAVILKAHIDTAEQTSDQAQGISRPAEEKKAAESLEDYAQDVKTAREKMQKLADAHGGDPDLPLALAERRERLQVIRRRQTDIAVSLQGSQAALAALAAEGEKLPEYRPAVIPARLPADEANKQEDALARLRAIKDARVQELNRVLETVTERHPEAKRLEQELGEIARRMATYEAHLWPRAGELRPNQRYAANRAAQSQAREQIARLKAEQSALDSEAAKIETKTPLAELRQAAREYQQAEDELRQAEAARERARDKLAEVESVRLQRFAAHGIDQNPYPLSLRALGTPHLVSRPRAGAGSPALVIVGAGLLGLVVGAFAALFIERGRGTVRSAHELQQVIKAPVLGVLNESAVDIAPARTNFWARTGGIWSIVAALLIIGVTGLAVYAIARRIASGPKAKDTSRPTPATNSGVPAEQNAG